MMLPPIANAGRPTVDRVASSQSPGTFKSDGVPVGVSVGGSVGGGRSEVLPPPQLQSKARKHSRTEVINRRFIELLAEFCRLFSDQLAIRSLDATDRRYHLNDVVSWQKTEPYCRESTSLHRERNLSKMGTGRRSEFGGLSLHRVQRRQNSCR